MVNEILKKFLLSAGRPLSVSLRLIHNKKLYPTHIPTNTFQKVLLSVGSAVISIINPYRADMIATMSETATVKPLLEHLYNRMERDINGRELLKLRPRICNDTIDLNYIKSLPNGTLGREYARFLQGLKTEPNARPPVQFVDDANLVYVMQRYRETHDLTHTLLEMKPNLLGEVTVKYFEAIQLGLPMCISAAIFGAIRLNENDQKQLIEHNLPWIVKQAQQSRFLLALNWEKRFEQTITDLQKECSIEPFLLKN